MPDLSRVSPAFLTVAVVSASLFGASGGKAALPARHTQPVVTGVYADYLAGQFAASEGDPQTAATEFLRALAVQPDNPDLVQQALMAALLTDKADAIGLARRLPSDPFAAMLLGNVAAQTGDWQGAAQHFAVLPSDGPWRLLGPLLIAWARQGAGETVAALAGLEALIGDQQYGSMYALHAGLIADLANRTADAARFYHIAESQGGPGGLGVAEVIASFEARHGHAATAVHMLDAATAATPLARIALPNLTAAVGKRPVTDARAGMAEAYLAVAAAARQGEQDQLAMVLVRMALDLQPTLTTGRMLAADILQAQGQFAPALAVLAPVAPTDPLAPVVTLRRAELASQLGKLPTALAELQTLARAYPKSSLPDAEIGDILRENDKFAAAIAAYSRAIARIGAPSALDWPLFYERGVCYDQANAWPQAQADFQRALTLSPNEPVVLNYLGYSWANRGEHLKQARQMLERAAQLQPDDGAIIDSLGWVKLQQGDTAGAVRTLEHAVELDPDDPTINGHLGDAYAAAGRTMEATYQWRRALTLNPQPADAAKLEAKLHEVTAQAAARPTSSSPVPR